MPHRLRFDSLHIRGYVAYGALHHLQLRLAVRFPAVKLVDVVPGEQVIRVGHGLELKVIPGRILEKHGPLFPRLPLVEHKHKYIRGDADKVSSVSSSSRVACAPVARRTLRNAKVASAQGPNKKQPSRIDASRERLAVGEWVGTPE